jgi:small-conductance mechanosensitive channel
MNLTEWLHYTVGGNSLLTWGSGLAVFIVVWLALGISRRLIRSRLHILAEHSQLMALQIGEQVVRETKGWFLLLMALFAGSSVLQMTPGAESIVERVAVVALLLQMGLWAVTALTNFLTRRRERQLSEDPSEVAAMDVLGFGLRVTVWAAVLLLTLDNLGVNITTLIAGLGVSGIAVALAAQHILGDLFASLSIVLDKPFAVGDFLAIDSFLGSVEKVGVKTTRMRSLSGEQLIFSNNDLLNSRIRNYGRMFERRVVFSVGVTYQTPPEKLKRIPAILREAIDAQDKVRFDRAHFAKYGDFALIFEIVYYVLAPDYNTYMDIHQAVNLIIYERFAEEDIEFAYPTQTLFLVREGGDAAAAPAAGT